MLVTLFSTLDWALRPMYQSYQTQAYFGMILYILFAIILCGILAAAAYLFSLSALQDSEKRSEYECGFEPFDSATRLPFDVHFYLVGILFLIFDVEIALLFPWVLGLRTSGWFGFYIMLGFILLLAIGFLYEWKRGALIWPSRQIELPYTSGMTNASAIVLFGVSDLSGPDLLISLLSQSSGLVAILPELTFMLLISYLLTVLALELGRGRSKKELALESLVALRAGLLCVALLYFLQLIFGYSGSAFSGYFLVNSYTTTFKLLTLLSGLFVLHNSDDYIRHHERHLLEYPIVLSLALLLMLLLVSAGHLISAFLALVGFSLNIYVLILFDAPTAVSREAGIKYFYLSAFSSGLFIYGIFLLFLVTGTGHFYEIATLLTCATELQSTGLELLQLSVVFILTGLFFKLSAFPGHLWAADVYEGSPDPVMAFFMLPAKVSVFSFVLNFLSSALEPLSIVWQPIIAFSAIGSLVWGCFAALAESKTKRFLAYASINQMGFLLLGVATNTHEGTRATILYIFLYVLMNMIFLTVYLHAKTANNAGICYLTDFRTLANTRWTYTWSLAVALLSMAGIPPLAGFFGKYYLLLHAQEQGLYGLVAVALVTSLVSTYYYLRLIKIFWFEGKVNAPTVQCTLSVSNQSLLFVAECCLWVFILVAGPILSGVDLVATNLALISPHAAAVTVACFF